MQNERKACFGGGGGTLTEKDRVTPGIVYHLDELDNMVVIATFHDRHFRLDSAQH